VDDSNADGRRDGSAGKSAGERVAVEPAPADEAAVREAVGVFEAALLDVSLDRVRAAASPGDLLVATRDGRLVGALLLGASPLPGARHVEAVAVRPWARRAGVGTALVDAAAEGRRLTVDARPGVREFWESAGFTIAREGPRTWGVRGRRPT
jgi:ribosomal protein S18 acetylase RimI-like enzyme